MGCLREMIAPVGVESRAKQKGVGRCERLCLAIAAMRPATWREPQSSMWSCCCWRLIAAGGANAGYAAAGLLGAVEAEVLVACGDADRLQQWPHNLGGETACIADPGSPIELFATSQVHPKTTPRLRRAGLQVRGVVVHVRDRGLGWRMLKKKRADLSSGFLFRARFFKRRGSGIGLSVVKLLMDADGRGRRGWWECAPRPKGAVRIFSCAACAGFRFQDSRS